MIYNKAWQSYLDSKGEYIEAKYVYYYPDYYSSLGKTIEQQCADKVKAKFAAMKATPYSRHYGLYESNYEKRRYAHIVKHSLSLYENNTKTIR
jgi:hypothetical protein